MPSPLPVDDLLRFLCEVSDPLTKTKRQPKTGDLVNVFNLLNFEIKGVY